MMYEYSVGIVYEYSVGRVYEYSVGLVYEYSVGIVYGYSVGIVYEYTQRCALTDNKQMQVQSNGHRSSGLALGAVNSPRTSGHWARSLLLYTVDRPCQRPCT
jgi:hypothetical protein